MLIFLVTKPVALLNTLVAAVLPIAPSAGFATKEPTVASEAMYITTREIILMMPDVLCQETVSVMGASSS